MNYRFQFGVVWDNFGTLLEGALLTFQLGVFAFGGGALIGLVLASLKTYGPWLVRFLVDCYVVFITNTPRPDSDLFPVFRSAEVGVAGRTRPACSLA